MGVYWRKSVNATAGIGGIWDYFICKRKRPTKRMMWRDEFDVVLFFEGRVCKRVQSVEKVVG